MITLLSLVVNGDLTGQRYFHEILRYVVSPFARVIGRNIELHAHDAGPHPTNHSLSPAKVYRHRTGPLNPLTFPQVKDKYANGNNFPL